MSSKLQLTTLAVLVSAALPAQAALYKVVEVTPGVSGSEYYGTAIQPSDKALNTSNPLGCFDPTLVDGSNSCDASAENSSSSLFFALAGETRNWAEGVSYREEVAFAIDNSFDYIEDGYDGFEDYCFFQLGYSTCEYWASNQWNGWYKELNGGTTPPNNSAAFIEAASFKSSEVNVIINSLVSAAEAIGNYHSSTTRNQAFNSADLANGTGKQSRAWAKEDTYTVGSISSGAGHINNFSKAAIWDGSNAPIELDWKNTSDNGSGNDIYAQGSARDLIIDANDSERMYIVGYNSTADGDSRLMQATIFKQKTPGTDISKSNWDSNTVANAQAEIGGDFIHSNSVVTNINENLVAVGQAKRSGSYPQNGAVANRLFVISDASSSTPSASFLSGGIFFAGAGGEMGGINNFNEIVGRIDVENNREYEGKQRRQRAFIYPYAPTEAARGAIFQNKAWIIDNLTNGGSLSSHNNQYRIYDASDINDAGVISATALKCAGGYDSVASDSYCGNGSTNETVVAVKLVPISDPAERSIESRPLENSTIERQGSSLGFGALTLLGLFGFMRKRIK
ncbi:DUF3466 family protein [Aliivibrio finisterrensis]|uniref:DUF3466 family protein n=1 Tax=Aliivibrio finisterrensis TaxID=511998 RepID=A0A4Q5KJB4_9GAMM|nr:MULTISPECIES: DUF3466 family protein [Aliivibrio]MDD9173816.1 DUF3466 family protein [Aliivibrio sp. S3TY1]MDD9190893.1 DUF3466 family protein [Aliivibrio sp. S2TY2]RYU46316.1 DUF3466 family protein [Aliivibrio finisterrensis]